MRAGAMGERGSTAIAAWKQEDSCDPDVMFYRYQDVELASIGMFRGVLDN